MSQRDRGMPTPPQSEQEANQEIEARFLELKKHIEALIDRAEAGELTDNSLCLLKGRLDLLKDGDLEAWKDFSRKYKKTITEITEFSKPKNLDYEYDFAENPHRTSMRLEDSNTFPARIGSFEEKGMDPLFKAWIRNRFTVLKGLVDEYNQTQLEGDPNQRENDKKEIVSHLIGEAKIYFMPKDLQEVEREMALLEIFSRSSDTYRQ